MASLFAPKPAPLPPAPEIKPVAPMPVADSNFPAQREARRRANATIVARAGRSSTILTAPGERGKASVSAAIKALAAGNANEGQQQRALHWIVHTLCGTYDQPYRPASERDTIFACAKMFVG
jgi:hypothetical protein